MTEKKNENLDENYNLDEDFEDEEEIITLFNDETKKEEDFRVIWYVDYNDKAYVLLNPVEPSEEIADDEVIICEYGENEKGEEYVLPVDSEKTLKAVYEEYVKEYEKLCENEATEQ